MKKVFPFVLWLLILSGVIGCSEKKAGGCTVDEECNSGFVCRDGICVERTEEDAGLTDGGDLPADAGADPGADPSADAGADPGADAADLPADPGGDPGELWLITPGQSIGPVAISTSMSNFTTLGQARALLGEAGTPVGQAKYTLGFRNDTLRISGIDSNDQPNGSFDDADHLIAVAALPGLYARTAEGLGVGSSFSEIHATAKYANPERSAIYPPYGEFPGGKMDFFFSLGIFIGYDAQDKAAFFTVTKIYPQAPDGALNPSAGTITFGNRTIQCGDGYTTGSLRDVHRGILGEPDWAYRFPLTVNTQYGPIDVYFYTDSYRVLGMEFIGGDDLLYTYVIDKLLTVFFYPPFYGKTAAGHGLGSKKSEWESELGQPLQMVDNPFGEGKVFVYAAGAIKFGVAYTNQGASSDDIATFLILNFQQQQ